MNKVAKNSIIIVAIALVIGAIVSIIVLTNHDQNFQKPQSVPTAQSAKPVAVTPSAAKPALVSQPENAKQVADSLGCTTFKDEGASDGAGVIDSGTCHLNGHLYGIDTFASKIARDAWLPVAENYGVVPKWETDTSVIYPSVTNTSDDS